MGTGLDPTTLRDFGIAMLIGALIGLEREQHKAREGGIGGLRTFILFAQAGAVSAWLSRREESPWIFAVTVMSVAAFIVVGYYVHARARSASLGLTTEVAALAVCLLGGMVIFGYPEIAVALAIVTSAVLAYKQPLHELVRRVGTDDFYAAVKLLIATFVVLPLLPNRTVDPWGALNPYQLWWLVILIAGLSLAGYVAVRWLGTARGSIVTGLSGGLASSTAVTLSFARQSRVEAAGSALSSDALAAGILVAWAVMFGRVIIEVAVVYTPLLPRLVLAMSVMGAAALIGAAVFYRRTTQPTVPAGRGELDLAVSNPFSLSWAMRFALLFAVVLLLVKLAGRQTSDFGVYVVAGVAGLTDVDPVTLSMAAFARDGGSPTTAVGAIVASAITNTLAKGVFVTALGSEALRRRMLRATAAILAAGAVALTLT